MQIKGIRKYSDVLGMVSAGLCVIHCIALPVFLLSTTVAATALPDELITHEWHSLGGTAAAAAPLGGTLDFLFIGLAILAVYFSSKKTSSHNIKAGMWLSVIIFGVALFVHNIFEYAQYISIAASLALMLLHFINIRHCKRCIIEKPAHKQFSKY